MFSRKVLLATVTPLASIFGSGFLIIVPVLESVLGSLAILGALGVCALAWLIGMAIRHNVATVEPLETSRELGEINRWIEKLADFVIVIAYVISVALYLRIMAEYLVEPFGGSISAERTVASASVMIIVAVGIFRGFTGLDLMERLALGAVLVLTTVFGGALFFTDAADLIGSGVSLPPVPDKGILDVLLVLGGIVITVQGFETVRYLADEYDARTRILASRLSQLVSASIYIGFVLVATPFMGIGTGDGPDDTLLDIAGRVVPLLTIPVVITAMLSQFSAATADTVAADGNIRRLLGDLGRPVIYLSIGGASILLIWVTPTFTIIALASRAFAAYYSLQCLLAMRTAEKTRSKVGFGLLSALTMAIAIFAIPAG